MKKHLRDLSNFSFTLGVIFIVIESYLISFENAEISSKLTAGIVAFGFGTLVAFVSKNSKSKVIDNNN
ncbi:MAG: hypothetical protein IT232_00650 [Flavobacteriales bacterium]|nr:hypothetical protein [Flavobacteriales bacterium]